MDEEQLRSILASLAILSNQGSIPVHTFSILVNSADCDELANQMHQRWLSNKNFGRVAALIVLHYHKADDTNLTLFSKCLYHILTDYRNRFMIRNKNRLVFRNSVRALLELYTTFRQIDPIISESLLKPIFSSLKMLIDDQADNNDIESLCEIFIDKGSILVKLKPIKCEKIILRMRTCLCEWQQLTTNTRRLLLKAMDFWTYNWNMNAIPLKIRETYEDYDEEREEKPLTYETTKEKNENVIKNNNDNKDNDEKSIESFV